VISNTTSGDAALAISYSFSPITQLGGTVTTTRIASSLQDAYTTASQASLGRTFGRRWFMQIHGGVGLTKPVRQTSLSSTTSTAPHPVAGGSFGYKTFSHTLLGSFDRIVSDAYGLGATTTSSANATWRWRRPGNSWWLDSAFGWQWLQGNAVTNTSGWHTTVGLNRAMGTHVVFSTQYAHLTYSGALQPTAYHRSQDAMRVSVIWDPYSPALR
jgi:hypothetical protein